jgi:hypothetical protein
MYTYVVGSINKSLSVILNQCSHKKEKKDRGVAKKKNLEQSERRSPDASGGEGGVEVYLDEVSVGVAEGGRVRLTGVTPGWHSLHILPPQGVYILT